ncbi:transmembrane protein, putative [Medicago truncatula]|uniref:Transmembrane protein, putative n=1 Tax=Medicago truncatula TaxID=3880 RepID=A0A072TNX9_MEDTR|nr:transmembrane protein, putative [Medicago truncatula]
MPATNQIKRNYCKAQPLNHVVHSVSSLNLRLLRHVGDETLLVIVTYDVISNLKAYTLGGVKRASLLSSILLPWPLFTYGFWINLV